MRRTAALATVLPLALLMPSAVAQTAPRPVTRTAVAAARYIARHDMVSGVAVVDTRTGVLYTAGNARHRFPSASVVKTLIATRLLLEGRMTGGTARLARRMITASDNAAATTLYRQVGRDRLLPRLARHYRIDGLGAPPTMRGVWGSTQLTARGLALFYAAVRKDPKVWPWLSRAMHAYRPVSSSGEPNAFGIAAAVTHAAVKNGWAVDRDVHHPSNAVINTSGFVDHNRFAVVILSEGPGSLYYRAGERIVTRAARLLMPRGRISIPPSRR